MFIFNFVQSRHEPRALLKADKTLLETKGNYIIRQLSIYLGPEDIYRSMAEQIQNERDLKFARLFVETLHTIMFTANELSSLRESLRLLSSTVSEIGGTNPKMPNFEQDELSSHGRILKFTPFLQFQESKELFVCLYKTWAHSSIALVALVFLAGCYHHAYELVQEIGQHEITLEFLLELDRFVQLMESPVFSCKSFIIERSLQVNSHCKQTAGISSTRFTLFC